MAVCPSFRQSRIATTDESTGLSTFSNNNHCYLTVQRESEQNLFSWVVNVYPSHAYRNRFLLPCHNKFAVLY